jgi:hypothetical protein
MNNTDPAPSLSRQSRTTSHGGDPARPNGSVLNRHDIPPALNDLLTSRPGARSRARPRRPGPRPGAFARTRTAPALRPPPGSQPGSSGSTGSPRQMPSGWPGSGWSGGDKESGEQDGAGERGEGRCCESLRSHASYGPRGSSGEPAIAAPSNARRRLFQRPCRPPLLTAV